MTSLIELLNQFGEGALRFAWPMLWQSSLLIGLLYGLDRLLRRRARAGVRYALWLLVLVKLVLPPSLALPTAPSWWLWTPTPPPSVHQNAVVVSYGEASAAPLPSQSVPVIATTAEVRLSGAAMALLVWLSGSALLLAWLLIRWRQIRREVEGAAAAAGSMTALLEETRRAAGVRRPVELKLLDRTVSPAVCGLVRPVVLVPRLLADQLSPNQLRAILWHELVHLRRGDVWVNCFQTLLQLAYWWHPLLWLANARIRAVREEAVDDAVMLALQEDSESYAPTLLEVARLALQRPLASLGLVGILESQRSLRQRIERLLEFRPPRKAGMTFAAVLCVLAFGAMAVPMGEGPGKTSSAPESSPNATPTPISPSTPGPTSREAGIPQPLVAAAPQEKTVATPAPAPVKSDSAALAPGQESSGAPTNRIVKTIASRRALFSKLDRIRLDTVSFEGLPLSEVIRQLSQASRSADPEGTGINFMINAKADSTLNPATGLPQPGAPEPVDISTLPITIKPALRQVRLTEALDAVVKVATKPIKYSIEDYAIVFSARVSDTVPLYTRVYKVNLDALRINLENASLRSGTKHYLLRDPREIQQAFRTFFANKGVELASPKTAFLNEREGRLIVRGTLQDLDTIDKALPALNTAPPQINFKAKFIELPEEAAAAFWKTFPAVAKGDVTDLTIVQDKVDTTSPTNFLKPTTLLREAQARAALKMLESNSGADVLNEASVTTLSGRQTQIEVVNLMNLVTLNPKAFTRPGVTNNATGTNGLYLTSTLHCGPVLDLVPSVETNGCTIQLALTASLTEFLGYDRPTNSVQVYINGKKQQLPPPLPRYHRGQVSHTCAVQDGDTVVLSGIQSETVSVLKDKVPVLGDVPLLGKLFRSESKSTQKKQVLVFITPTLIDAAGNRLYSDDTRRASKAK